MQFTSFPPQVYFGMSSPRYRQASGMSPSISSALSPSPPRLSSAFSSPSPRLDSAFSDFSSDSPILNASEGITLSPRSQSSNRSPLLTSPNSRFQLSSSPQLPSSPSKQDVEMGRIGIANNRNELLTTVGLSDCSAIVILGNQDSSGIYHSRALLHVTGSNLEAAWRSETAKGQITSFLQSQKSTDDYKILFVLGENNNLPSLVGGPITRLLRENNLDHIPVEQVQLDLKCTDKIAVEPDGNITFVAPPPPQSPSLTQQFAGLGLGIDMSGVPGWKN